ncbi:MAG: efflux RND transporter periplasmic adaptor subunit [Bacteroidota bacterium]
MSTRTKLLLIGGIVVVILTALIVRNKAVLNSESGTGSVATAYSVSVATVQKEAVEDKISAVGTLNAINDVVVLSETQGRILKVDCEVGDFKKAGSILVEVDSELKEAAYKTAEVTYERAKKDLQRYEALSNEHSISDSQIEQARWSFQSAEAQFITARRQLTDTKITTPISGIVTARYVNQGTMVVGAPQATQIANIVDISKMKAKIFIAEKDVFHLHVGDPAEVTTDVYPEASFAGKVFTIGSKGDEGHTYPVEILLDNSKQQLRAGMFVTITIKPHAGEESLVIPREAIVGSFQDAKVFVVKNKIASLRSIVAEKEIGTIVRISSGLEVGEAVVTDGQNNLSDNTPVIVRN